MKKRILALLLAGILTASMTSCFNRNNNPSDTTGGNTEEVLTRAPGGEGTTQAPDTWKEVTDTVYTTTDNLTLRTDIDSNENTLKVNKLTELKRTAYNTKWSRVEYNSGVYYVSNSYITSDDIYGKTLTPCEDTLMYVITDGLNVRTLASSNSTISPSVGSLKLNETVIVIAKGDDWCRIEYSDEEGGEPTERYVSAKYLAKQPYENPDTKDYSSYFTKIDPAKTMYVTASAINLRKAPSVNASIMGGLEQDDEVIVVGYAESIPEVVDGEETTASWYKVKVTIAPEKEGDPPTTAYYYASAKYISDKPGSTTLTLADMLEQYPTFSANSKTLYVCTNAANARTTPSLKNNDNITKTLEKKDQVKVVATGVYEDNNWCMIELEEGVFAFIGSSTLTTDPNGEPAPLSLEDLLIKYPQYEAVSTPVTLTAKSTVNCYTSPSSAETVPLKLNAGDTVTLVAVPSNDDSSWCVIQAANGNCYFAGYSLFEVAAQ